MKFDTKTPVSPAVCEYKKSKFFGSPKSKKVQDRNLEHLFRDSVG